MPNGKDSKIMEKSTPRVRLNMPPNLFYNCREPSPEAGKPLQTCPPLA